MAAIVCAVVALLCLGSVSGQPTNANPGQTPIVTGGAVLPDNTFVASTWAQVAAGQAALQSYNDFDLYNFLVNTECLEAEFDSAATFGVPLDPLLQAGGPGAIGARRANISAELLPFLQETARDEAGHVRLIREALGPLASPCPLVNISAFGTFFANAFNRTFDPPFDPFANDVNLVLAIWSLEEIGSTGDKGVAVLLQNATMRDGAAGLAVSRLSGVEPAVHSVAEPERDRAALQRHSGGGGAGHFQLPGFARWDSERGPGPVLRWRHQHRAHRRQWRHLQQDAPAGAEHLDFRCC
jgi:hypothetical protein